MLAPVVASIDSFATQDPAGYRVELSFEGVVSNLDWFFYSGTGHYYAVTDTVINWSQADTRAVSFGGQLASITSQGEQDFLTTTFVDPSTPGGDRQPFWIGATDRATEGTFEWTTGEAFGYNNWAPNEPNDNGGNEDYTAFNFHYGVNQSNEQGTWNDTTNTGSVNGSYRGIIELDFDPGPGVDPIDETTFDRSDLLVIAPDLSPVSVVAGSVQPVGSTGVRFEFLIDGQTVSEAGLYQITIGPNIADTLGNLMDQDGDGTGGESIEDQFNGQFQIAFPEPVPVFNSNPSAPVDLYLDFDGHFQASWGGNSNLNTPVWDTDGDPNTFSSTEEQKIYEIWSRVVEHFAPFDINVTTVQPSVLAEGVPENDANGVAFRIAIGPHWNGSSGSGGVAFINSFTDGNPNIAYTYADAFTGVVRISETVSHEAGHGFGLYHQSTYDEFGNKINEYNPGDGYWAPLMGGGQPYWT